jgi:hypothetical protein
VVGRISPSVPATDRRTFVVTTRRTAMSDTDLLGLILAGIAVLMFATGIILVT